MGRECVTLDNGAKGDDGQGSPCKDANLDLTHGVTVNDRSEPSGVLVFGNATARGDIDLTGNKNRIVSQTVEIVNNLPAFKGGAGLAMAIGGGALRRGLLTRAATNIGIAGGKVGENAIVGNLANGTLVSVGVEVSGGNFTATVFGVAGSAPNGTSLLPLVKGLIRAARAEGASSLKTEQ